MITALSDQLTRQFLNWIISNDIRHEYQYTRHRLNLLDEMNNNFGYIRLPLQVQYPGNSASGALRFITVLIQSGNAATGIVENEKLIDHKVFTAYMVRKKQGKSQIKHLKTKGKSRAGSRIRLAGTVKFFENINTRLQRYFENNEIDRIALSCSKTLIPYLFGSKVKCPFDKKDERIYMIPKDIPQPNFAILKTVNKFLLRGDLHYEEIHRQRIEEMFAAIA